MKDLVARLAARRLPLDEAQKAATDFLVASGAAKQAKAKLLFAGLFTTLDRLRSEVITGIERYTRRQREFAEKVRAETLKLREMNDVPNAEQKQVEDLAERVEWDTRIFEERRRTINYVCEVPVLIEQRLFELGRAIRTHMKD